MSTSLRYILLALCSLALLSVPVALAEPSDLTQTIQSNAALPVEQIVPLAVLAGKDGRRSGKASGRHHGKATRHHGRSSYRGRHDGGYRHYRGRHHRGYRHHSRHYRYPYYRHHRYYYPYYFHYYYPRTSYYSYDRRLYWYWAEGGYIPPAAIVSSYYDGKRIYVCKAYHRKTYHSGRVINRICYVDYRKKRLGFKSYWILVR